MCMYATGAESKDCKDKVRRRSDCFLLAPLEGPIKVTVELG